MASTLDIPLYEICTNRKGIVRYIILTAKTLGLILKNKIKVLFVQNPSLVLALLAVSLRRPLGLTVIVDAHNGGLYPKESRFPLLNWAARLVCRKADCVIVTNRNLAATISDWGAEPLVMPDPVPDFSHHAGNALASESIYVLFVCTWADDEPYREVLKAASMLQRAVSIYVTGNYRKILSEEEASGVPSNVKLLGFVSEHDYIWYLKGATAVLDLTTREDCLVCGAYESLSLCKPGIVSDSLVNRDIFSKGFVYTENSANSISESIIFTLEHEVRLKRETNEMLRIHQRRIDAAKKDLMNLLRSILNRSI